MCVPTGSDENTKTFQTLKRCSSVVVYNACTCMEICVMETIIKLRFIPKGWQHKKKNRVRACTICVGVALYFGSIRAQISESDFSPPNPNFDLKLVR